MDKYVPIDEVLAYAESLAGAASDIDKTFFKQWAWESLKFFGVSEDEIEVCVVKPKNLVAEKPTKMKILIDLKLYSEDVTKVEPSSANQLEHIFRTGKKRINQVIEYPKTYDSLGNIKEYIDISEDKTHFILGTNGDCVKSIMVRYFAYPLDEHGQPLIRQEDTFGVALFIKYSLAMRHDDRALIATYAPLWKAEADRIRGMRKGIHHESAKSTMRRFVSLIPTFNQQSF